jgi:hypothetical protein
MSKFEQSGPSMCLNVSGNWAPELSQVVSKFEQSRPSMCLNVSGNWVLEISQVVSYEIEPGSLLTGFTSREYVHLHEIEPRFPLTGVTSRDTSIYHDSQGYSLR